MAINGVECLALLDTGATVSTISQSFYCTHLKGKLDLHQLNEEIDIECADGQLMPYLGYVLIDLATHGLSSVDVLKESIFLVVPDSNYNKKVPVLIGTNILYRLLDITRSEFGSRFLQDADLHASWYLAFRCITLRERQLVRNRNRLAVLKSAESTRILIPSNGKVVINAYMDRKLPYQKVLAMLHSTPKSSIPNDLDITPSLHYYDCEDASMIPVEISNVTTRTVCVSPKALLSEMQPVTIAEIPTKDAVPSRIDHILDKVSISDTLTVAESEQCANLISGFQDIFSTSSTDIGTTSMVKHHIELSDTTPFKQKYRRIPPAMVEEVRTHLKELIASGVIRPSHSPFSSNVVLVRKSDGSLRMCVDYR